MLLLIIRQLSRINLFWKLKQLRHHIYQVPVRSIKIEFKRFITNYNLILLILP